MLPRLWAMHMLINFCISFSCQSFVNLIYRAPSREPKMGREKDFFPFSYSLARMWTMVEKVIPLSRMEMRWGNNKKTNHRFKYASGKRWEFIVKFVTISDSGVKVWMDDGRLASVHLSLCYAVCTFKATWHNILRARRPESHYLGSDPNSAYF